MRALVVFLLLCAGCNGPGGGLTTGLPGSPTNCRLGQSRVGSCTLGR